MLVSENKMAPMIGVEPQTLQNWRVSGRGPRWYKLPSGGVRYDVDEVLAWAKSQPRRSTSDDGAEAA